MSEARCTLQVRGLDCPKEVDALTAALNGQAGVVRLGFDLIHGTMTVDYDDNLVDPQTIVGRITERTGLQATLEGEVEQRIPPWWSRRGRSVVTVGSGVALAAGIASLLDGGSGRFGASGRRSAGAGRLCVGRGRRGHRDLSTGCPQLGAATVRYRRSHGAGDPGSDRSGPMGRGRHGGFPVWPIRNARGAEPGLRAAVDPRALELAPPAAERIGADGTTEVIAASQVRRGRPGPGPHRAIRSGRWHGGRWGGRASIRRRSRASRSRYFEKRAIRSTRERSTATGRWKSGRRGQSVTPDLSGRSPRFAQARPGRAPIERRITRFAAVYTPMVIALVAPGHARSATLGLGLGRAGAVDVEVWREWFGRGLVVLVIACPCALVIATPVAVVCGLAAAARGAC